MMAASKGKAEVKTENRTALNMENL